MPLGTVPNSIGIGLMVYHTARERDRELSTLRSVRLLLSHRWTFLLHLITARVQSTTGGYVFTGVCLFNFRGEGTPSSWQGGTNLRSRWGGTPYQVQVGRVPIPGPGWLYPIQVMGGGVIPYSWPGGVPNPWSRWGAPNARSMWGVPHPRSRQGGTTSSWRGTSHPDLWWGTPPPIQVCIF